ncbi:MAG: ATP-binding protein, partial [Mycobacteriaceae bacterium]|nr:ATP-binding protein [Mycobacteriaceae bacterium]
MLALFVRHCINLVVAVAALADRDSLQPAGRAILAVLGCWAVYRLVTRSPRTALALVDLSATVAVCLAIPAIVATPDFYKSYSAPLFVAWAAIVGVAGQFGPSRALPMAAAITGAYAVGAAGVIGWAHVPQVDALQWFALGGATTMLIRLMLRRAAAEIDRARAVRVADEVRRNVTTARANYDREQLALLHDTAASTLLLVEQQTPVPPSQLAALARRDLKLLRRHPWDSLSRRVDLVAAVRGCADHARTPVQFTGRPTVWIDGSTAKVVTAAVREALTNADRHAGATSIVISTQLEAITVSDNGVGFGMGGTPGGTSAEASAGTSGGRGIAESIIGRMHRIGGTADVASAPGRGTTVTLSWKRDLDQSTSPDSVHPDHLIERMWVGWGLALVAYAVVTVAVRARYSILNGPHPHAELALALTAAVCALAALPGILWGRWRLAWPAAAALLVITVIQPALVGEQLDSRTHWSYA